METPKKDVQFNCFITSQMLSDYIDGRDMEEDSCREKIDEHLKECPDCTALASELKRNMELFKLPQKSEAPPAQFGETFLARLREHIDQEKARRQRWERISSAIAIAAMITIIIGAVILLSASLSDPVIKENDEPNITVALNDVMTEMHWGGQPEKLAVSIKEQKIIDEAQQETDKAKVEAEKEPEIVKVPPTPKIPSEGGGGPMEIDYMASTSEDWLTIDESEIMNNSRSLEKNMGILHNK